MGNQPSRSRTTGAPSQAALARAADAYEDLDLDRFGPATIRRLLAGHAGAPDPLAQARAFLQVHLDNQEVVPDDLEAPGGIVTFLILLVGRETLGRAIRAELAEADAHTARLALLLLAELAGVAIEATTPARRLARQDAAELQRLAVDEPFRLATHLIMLPPVVRAAAVAELLAARTSTSALVPFAGQLLLMPLDEATHAHVRAWLARPGHIAGAWALAYLAGERPPGPGPASALPLAWPLESAYAGFPDGEGTQALCLVRRHPGRRRAFAISQVWVNDWRGIAHATTSPGLGARALDAALAEARAEQALVPVAFAYVRQRLEAGLARTEALGVPLPLTYRVAAPLFAGLPEARLPGLDAAPGWGDPARLAATAALGKQAFFGHWYLEPGDLDGLPGFFAESDPIVAAGALLPPAAPSDLVAFLLGRDEPSELAPEARARLDEAITRWLPRLFDDAARHTWRQRLLEVARLYDRVAAPALRDLAATAAWALDPASGVPLAEQPVMRQLMFDSAKLHAEPLDDGDDECDEDDEDERFLDASAWEALRSPDASWNVNVSRRRRHTR